MKKRSIGLSILAVMVLAGCTKTQPSTISFDTFSTTIKSPYFYKQTKIYSQNQEIKKIYTSTESGFQSSIIIANQTVMSGDSISFANENLKNLRSNLANKGEITESKNIELSCGDIDIPASLSTIEVKQNGKVRYISQMYFVYEHVGYIVSHLTEEESEVSKVQKGFKNIECIAK